MATNPSGAVSYTKADNNLNRFFWVSIIRIQDMSVSDISTGGGNQDSVYKTDGTITLDISLIGYPFEM